MVGEIKGFLQRQAEAGTHVKKTGEAYQNSAYDPGGFNAGGSFSPN
jgi:hypothetical protein